MIRLSITVTSILLLILAGILIALTLIFSNPSYGSTSGWIAVLGASVIFGGTGIPMKSLTARTNDNIDGSYYLENIDSMIFAMYTGLGVFLVNVPLLIYLLWINSFHYITISILGSTDILIISYFAFLAVQRLGFAKASALWAGIGMIIAFLWGSLYFKEPIRNTPYAITAIVLLVIGVYSVSISQSNMKFSDEILPVESKSPMYAEVSMLEMDSHSKHLKDDDQQVDRNFETKIEIGQESVFNFDLMSASQVTIDSKLKLSKGFQSFKKIPNFQTIKKIIMGDEMLGYILCVLTGFCDGTLMVPFKSTDTTNLIELYNYLASFGLSSLYICPSLYILYVYTLSNGKISIPALKIAMVPGLLSGTLWAAANFMSVHATYYLGIRVGFPLTQTCVIFTALWGIFYFKEIAIVNQTKNLFKFCGGVCFTVIGSYFLAASGDE